MEKIGIITLNGYVNYGNRLQNYALQEVLKTYNYEVETIWVIINKNKPSDFTFREKVVRTFSNTPKENLQKIKGKIMGKLVNDNLYQQRMENFKTFSKRYIHETSYKISKDNIPKGLEDEYDFFVTGSDQVWNPFFRKGDPTYFLTFAPEDKRIAYAPSFGTDKIPKEFKKRYKNWISEMAHLSVREEAGAKIIKELSGRDAPVLVDPTLLLDKHQWLSIAKSPSQKPKSKYLLTYFLGDVSLSTKRYINKVAKSNELQVINLAKESEKEVFLSGPSEFIHYINNATLFLTDSFHGGVFSILLETPFVVFNRAGKLPSMTSRIDTLLSKFKYENRHFNNINTNEDLFNIDFNHVQPILNEEKKKAFDYIERALKVK